MRSIRKEELAFIEPLASSSLSGPVPAVESRFTAVPVELEQPAPFSPDLINLSSASTGLYHIFKRDRYQVVVLGGDQSSVDFADFLSKDVEALRSVRCLLVDSVCPLHAWDAISTLVEKLHHLQAFIYSGTHGLHPSIVRALCSLQKRGRLNLVHVGSASFESVTELAKNRPQKQGGPLSNLKTICLEQEDALEWDREDPALDMPPWLDNYPPFTWEAVEHDLLHDAAKFLSRSKNTLEILDINLIPFYTSSYFSSDAPFRTMFFDHDKPEHPTTSDGSPPPRVLEFPRLTTLSLPPFDLTSPVAIQLLRTSPLLENLTISHDPIQVNGTSIELPPLPNLVSLRFENRSSFMEFDFGSPPFLDVVESLRGTTSLRTLDIDATGIASFVDQPRLVAVALSFTNLSSLTLTSADWRCSIDELQTTLSTLKSLHTFAFDLDPDLTAPPSPIPEANHDLIDDGDTGGPDLLIGVIMDYFYEYVTPAQMDLGAGALDYPTEELKHFDRIAQKIATSVLSLKTLEWQFDELYSMIWEVKRDESGKILAVKGHLECDDLDDMALENELNEEEAETDEDESEEDEDDEEEDEDGDDEEEDSVHWEDVD